MNRTVIAISYNRHMQEATRSTLGEFIRAGAKLVQQTGSADVSLARNQALTMALRVLSTLNRERATALNGENPDGLNPAPFMFDTVLMIDDDIACTLEQAQELVTHARDTGVPASAMYSTINAALAGTRLFTPPGEPYRWVVGLGLLAIPVAVLRTLAKASVHFDLHGEEQVEFTWSGTIRGKWHSEDYTFCRRLGGVHLLPIPVAHMKTIPIYPHADSVACIKEGRRLPGELDSTQLEHLTDAELTEPTRARDDSL
ncbi:MAG TPA: hypothetical protein VGI10_10110 [Polyangiaceae bacterium]|jgi:hypothetical protein